MRVPPPRLSRGGRAEDISVESLWGAVVAPQWRVGQYRSGCHLQGGTKGWREGGTCLSSVSRPLIDFSLPCDLTKTSDLLGCALFGFISQRAQ